MPQVNSISDAEPMYFVVGTLRARNGVAMLVISRRKGQRIAIGDEIELVVTELHRSSVKLGIRAPKGYAVLRGEVRDSIEEANRQAATTAFDEASLGETAAPPAGKAPTDLLRVRQPAGEGAQTASAPAAAAAVPTTASTTSEAAPPSSGSNTGPEIIRRRPAKPGTPTPNDGKRP
jgi:carbon storage regulator